MAKYCTKCGIRMDDNDMVCPECGMQQGGYASPKEMQSIDGMRPQESNGKSVASLVLGIVGVIAWCLPILGLPVGVIGLIMGIQGYNRSNAKGMAMAGIVVANVPTRQHIVRVVEQCFHNVLWKVELFRIKSGIIRGLLDLLQVCQY